MLKLLLAALNWTIYTKTRILEELHVHSYRAITRLQLLLESRIDFGVKSRTIIVKAYVNRTVLRDNNRNSLTG